MDFLGDIGSLLVFAQETHGGEEEGGSFLVSPGLGLMIWTLIAFGITYFVLKRAALPRIADALEKRANAIRENIEASEKTRQEADELLAEYRQRLKEAREQADDIVARARKASENLKLEAADEGKAKREELVGAARKDIEAETRRSLEQIRKEVADLTVLATEKVTRKSLSGEDQKRLVEEALAEVDFSALAGNGGARAVVDEIARVYGDALFEAALDKEKLDEIHEQLGQFTDAIDRNRDLQVFFFSPYFSSAEKRDGIARAIEGAEPELVNFLELLAEKHRMPAIFRIRQTFDDLYAKHNKRLDVTVTSAVELDPSVVERVGEEIERQTGQNVELHSAVDENILGGLVLRVGNMVLDASLRNRLEKMRREIARPA